MKKISSSHIGIIGLGYVGLPLAVEFGKKYKTIGYDISCERIEQLKKGIDKTREIKSFDILNSKNLTFSGAIQDLKDCNFYIITVPTPVDDFKKPDLTPLKSATKAVSKILSKGDIVVFESTVFPGCTEEICVPILESNSNLKYNQDFFCGYSPERIVPGDKKNTLTTITKVTSGSTAEITEFIDSIYSSIIKAGTFMAASIKTAEASKVIENAQRDLNISFVNELALIFDKMNLDTNEVLDAASSKWNFLNFRPGLVGGHCISVDPYYLTYKAESLGYYPQIILSGRRINEYMSEFISSTFVKMLNKNNKIIQESRVLILGITFKENVPDIRNSKIVDVYSNLIDYGLAVDIADYEADPDEVYKEFGIRMIDKLEPVYDGIILAVAHRNYHHINFETMKKDSSSIIYDLKGILSKNSSTKRL